MRKRSRLKPIVRYSDQIYIVENKNPQQPYRAYYPGYDQNGQKKSYRKTFTFLEKAKKFCAEKIEQIDRIGLQNVPNFTPSQLEKLRDYLKVYQSSHVTISLEECLYGGIKRMLGDNLRLKDYIDSEIQYMESQIGQRLGKKQFHQNKTRYKLIEKDLGDFYPDDLTAKQINDYLLGKKWSNKTRQSFKCLITRILRKSGKIDILGNLEQFPTSKRNQANNSQIGVYEPEDVQRILTYAKEKQPDILGLLVFVLFVGLRQEECLRLRWEDVDSSLAEHSEIHIQDGKEGSRNVVVNNTAKDWLEVAPRAFETVYEVPGEEILQPKNLTRHIRKLVTRAGVTSVSNGLRHSFGTYGYFGIYNRDIIRLAEQMGNSPNMIRNHYCATKYTKDAKRFWEISPYGEAERIGRRLQQEIDEKERSEKHKQEKWIQKELRNDVKKCIADGCDPKMIDEYANLTEDDLWEDMYLN